MLHIYIYNNIFIYTYHDLYFAWNSYCAWRTAAKWCSACFIAVSTALRHELYAWRETICQGWISHDTPVKESCEPRHFWCSNERSLWWAEQPDRFCRSIQWGPLAFVAFGLAIQNLIQPSKQIDWPSCSSCGESHLGPWLLVRCEIAGIAISTPAAIQDANRNCWTAYLNLIGLYVFIAKISKQDCFQTQNLTSNKKLMWWGVSGGFSRSLLLA